MKKDYQKNNVTYSERKKTLKDLRQLLKKNPHHQVHFLE